MSSITDLTSKTIPIDLLDARAVWQFFGDSNLAPFGGAGGLGYCNITPSYFEQRSCQKSEGSEICDSCIDTDSMSWSLH